MKERHSAWNPGLESDIPPAYRVLETIYRPEHVSSSIADIDEISAQTGLSRQELVVFKPMRLALHELIIRVTADIVVLEGKDEIELGKNFRSIVRTILSRYIEPCATELEHDYDQLRREIRTRVEALIFETLFTPHTPVQPKRNLFSFGRRQTRQPGYADRESTLEREQKAISSLKERGLAARDALSSAIFRNVYHLLGSLAGNRGYLGPDPEFLISLACNRICNTYGSEQIGEKIAPLIDAAIAQEGYTRINSADNPLLISLKGASAAGKSSLRPMLQRMMSEHGIQPGGYAIISPDVWRRLLLDYESLGPAYKYAGRLTSHELIIIDGKLDHYLREKANRLGAMPHLLVDRFRFDSFSTERIGRILHDTYVKHVHTLAMYFVVTPPHATVERGWERGLQTGRYKAVEDFLDHSIEAYTGMPKILFKWLAYQRPLFRYEFLDNSVPKGTYPKTIAFGTQHEMNIVDCSALIDIERYQKINIRARCPEQVYPDAAVLAVNNNIGFLRQCVNKIPRINFLDPQTGVTYLTTNNGNFKLVNDKVFMRMREDGELRLILRELAPELIEPHTGMSADSSAQREHCQSAYANLSGE